MAKKRLYRSQEDKVIAGVCGGIAEHTGIDSVWVRLIAILLLFFDGGGLIAYLVLWAVVPQRSERKKSAGKRRKQHSS